jgi:hypothetical protein
MNTQDITIAFHGVDASQYIKPLDLDQDFQLCSKTHDYWKERILEISKICKDKGYQICTHYQSDPDKKWIHILLIELDQLKSNTFFNQIPGSDLRPVVHQSHSTPNSEIEISGRYDPIITISYEDFLDLNTMVWEEEAKEERKRTLHECDLDTRAKFLDSSIWHRYVPELPGPNPNDPNSKPPTFRAYFEDVLKEITGHWAEGLYYTVSAVTTLEFQLRMLRHSFIGQFGEGGHAGVVTPFKFHSERHLQRRAQLSEDNFLTNPYQGKSLLQAIQWRMLLVDDQANKPLSTIKGQNSSVTKSELVRRPLDLLYKTHHIDPEKQLELVSPLEKDGVIQFGIDQISKQSFDIIFLDYLLGERPGSVKGGKNREYGHEFLLALIQDSRNGSAAYHRDFFGRYWIFPVSSFPFALSDKLSQLGVGHLHSIWHLSTGGDPVTTPHLYAFYFFRFLKQKVAEYYLYPKALQRLINEIPEFPGASPEQNIRLWAQCLKTAFSHYLSRLDVLSESVTDATFSPFLKSMEDFLNNHVRIRKLLNAILATTDQIADDITKEEMVKTLQELIAEEYKDYHKCMKNFFLKANSGMLEAMKRIDAAGPNGTLLNLRGLNLGRLPNDLALKLPQLRNLDLAGNNLTEVSDIITKLPNLRVLNLARNNLASVSTFQPLGMLDQLSDLDLTGNPLNETAFIQHYKGRQAVLGFLESLDGFLKK